MFLSESHMDHLIDLPAAGKLQNRNRAGLIAALVMGTVLFAFGTLRAKPASTLQKSSEAQDTNSEQALETAADSVPGEADSAARLFLNRCSGCHTIGGGPLTGPDLQSSMRWPRSDLEQATRRMQKNVGPLTEEQIQMLVDFMKSDDVRQRLQQVREGPEPGAPAGEEEEGSAQLGRRLFFGESALTNRGTACVACHQVQGVGGTLAADLTKVSERLGMRPLISGIRQSGYPVMNAVYRSHPITDREALHLATFLQSVEEDPESAKAYGGIWRLYLSAASLTVLLLALLYYFYRNRNLGTRAQLVRRGSRGKGAA